MMNGKRMAFLLFAALAAIVAVYLWICFDVLWNISTTRLVSTRMLDRSSKFDPIEFPMPDWMVDFYWESFGSDRAEADNLSGNDVILFLVGSSQPVERPQVKYDPSKAQELLSHYVCKKSPHSEDYRELLRLGKKLKYDGLNRAIEECGGGD